MKGKHEKGVGGCRGGGMEAGKRAGEQGREGGCERVSEQGRHTDDGRCCLVWSNQATGYNSSQ